MDASEAISNPVMLNEREHKNWNEVCDEMLLAAEDIKIPSDAFGLIRGTTWHGGTYHINSVIVDLGWEGSLVLEVNARKEPADFGKPKLILELYRVTNLNQ